MRGVALRTPGAAAARAPGALSASDILALHDAGAGLDWIDRTLLVLSRGNPEGWPDHQARLPLGSRDKALLELYSATFGPALDAVADCAGCGAKLDVPMHADALIVEPAPHAPREIAVGEWRLTIRPLDSADLARARHCRSPVAAAQSLAAATIVGADRCHGPVLVDTLPPEVIEAAGEAVSALDPMAEIVLDVACPACGSVTPLAFDAGLFLWEAIDRAAGDLLDEVVVLAGRYGWSEREVLAMSPARRLHYLAAAGR
jgi:hypothetical protein